ncbi:alanine racemase [Bacillus sp. B1-b2]|uniref:alanine racemase n=1 Tax=Bacillus sp. B1-b2 TaxID=2653201 RepID=UPI0012627E09|nr:alanine racemase [Bacillus sp. B1-b2]KAB7663459.1 alanine racemase [Bacillus sp. B1-b2]
MRNTFYRDTWVEVNLDAIKYNISHLRNRLHEKNKLIAVVKANAYGHGSLQVAKTALNAGADSLAVAFLDEAISLREKGVKAPILVLGASRARDVKVACEYKITLTVFQVEWLEEALCILEDNTYLPIHLKLDTGMGRIGFRTKEDIRKIEDLLCAQSRIKVEGVFTHFATADEKDTTYLDKQIARFRELLNGFSQLPEIIHCSNSAASLLHPELQYNAVRMGISMYGLTPSLEIENDLPYPLKEAFSLRSKIVQVKKLHKGDKVSYGATYEAEEEQWIATLPIGYADGWLRKLQGIEVLVDGMRVPIVGRICMDQCMVRLPYEMKTGTKVTLIGSQKHQSISVNEVATKLETINYEITCMISSRVPRVYLEDGEYMNVVNPLLD